MNSPEQSALREVKKPTDGGLGITEAFSNCLEDTLKEARKAQCAFLNAKPAEVVLPKAEIKEESGNKFIEFSAANKETAENAKQLDQWLDGKTKLQRHAA